MKKYSKIDDEKTVLTVGYVSPGWPLSHFPNGIVAYVQNLLSGLDDRVKPVILTRALVEIESNESLIDLSNLIVDRTLAQKLLDKIVYGIELPCMYPMRYQRNAVYIAENLNLAIRKLATRLDLLEMEESFGFAYPLIKICKVPIVTRLHGPCFVVGPYLKLNDDNDFKSRVSYEGKAIKYSHGVTAPSLDVLEKVREYYNLALPQAKVIPNPVLAVSKDKQWKYDTAKTPSILFVGRFDSVKGGDLALEAFRLVALKNKEVMFSFVGPDGNVSLKGKPYKFNDYLEQVIPEASIRKRIQFLGHCNSQTIADLRKNSLITIFPSRYENFPVSLLEALSTGCPTVAAAVGGIKEIVVNDYNGLLAEPDSAESIAEKVLDLMEHPEKMQLLSKNAIQDCNARFSPKAVASQTIDYYKNILNISL